MGYAKYIVTGGRHAGEECGYAVTTTCDEDGCDATIDRGLDYLCGESPGGGDGSCGGYFCETHLACGKAGKRCMECFTEDDVPDDLVLHAGAALMATADGNVEVATGIVERIASGSAEDMWAATAAWAEVAHKLTEQEAGGRFNAIEVDGAYPEGNVDADAALLSCRIVACFGNGDGQTALMLWHAAGPERALAASVLVLELAGQLVAARQATQPNDGATSG